MSTNLEDLNYLIMTEVLECMDVFDAHLAIRAKELEDAGIFSKFVPLLDGELNITLSE